MTHELPIARAIQDTGRSVQPVFLWPAQFPGIALGAGDLHVWGTELSAEHDRSLCLERLLSHDERSRLTRFIRERDQRRFLVARTWLRKLLASYLNVSAAEILFSYSERGKPSVAHPATDLVFNLAHADELAVCAITRGREVGIDIERIEPSHDLAEIARRYFAAGEVACLNSLPPAQKCDGFYNCWTRKEAYLKATGAGITAGLDRFEVSLIPGEPARLLAHQADPLEVHRWELHDLKPAADFAAAVAVKGDGIRISCHCSPPPV